MRARLTSSRFVGRIGELAELELASREAAANRPGLVLIGGDSGVGKTRLVSEFERRMADSALLVLRGEAVEQGEGELPYAPLLGALRPLVRERHQVLDQLSNGSRAQLAALLPGLDQQSHPAAERDDPSAQLRLFEALLELLDLLAESCPLALILEDVHWADRSTRTFVAFLARSLRQERLLLVLTYRSDELHRRHALRPLLSELERLDRARRIDLEPFDHSELTEALADILGDEPSEELVDRLFDRSEGNPLFTEELLAAGLDGRGSAPQSLRDAFLLRIERLSPSAQEVARVIAVGRRLDEATIAEVLEIGHEAIHAALRDAVAEQILVTVASGAFTFRHALLREALYDDLLPGERVELHLVLARLLEQRCAANHELEAEQAAMVASHYAAAGDQPAALRSTVRAALAARDVHAYGDVADLAERALELWPRVPEEERNFDLDHVDLLLLAARAHAVVDDRGRIESLLQSALGELDPDVDSRRYATVLAELASTRWQMNRGIEGVETAQRALELLPEDADEERVALLAWLARTRFLRGRFRDAQSDALQALRLARDVRDRETQVELLNTLGMAQIALGELQTGVGSLRESIEIARAEDNVGGVAQAFVNLADLLHLRGHTREALETAREGLAGVPRWMTSGRQWMLLTLSELEFEAGEWESARSHMDALTSQQTGVLQIFGLLRDAELALGEGLDETASAALAQAEPLVGRSSQPQWIGALGALLGELRRRQGDLAGAREAVEHALGRIELCTDDVMRIARVAAAGARIEADMAQRARDLHEKRDEREAVTRADLHLQRLQAVAEDGGPVELAWSKVGAAELARARGRNRPALWAEAAGEWEAMERPYLVAQMRWREAEAHVEAGDRTAAAPAAQTALDIAGRLGAGWLEAEVRALCDRARLELGGGSLDGTPASATKVDGAEPNPFGLTDRERQVLSLLAEGATNRQIGTALFMAEKTASVHVSRILSKLGVRSRTQAAAVAHRMHLSRPASR